MPLPTRRAAFAGLLLTPLLAQTPPAAATAELEPTAEETAVLCWVNRFRRDPAAFAELVLDGHRPENADHVDWQLFAAELQALRPAPPVFFEPRLLQAARAHAGYMVTAKEYGHHETQGRPGFTGEWPHERAAAAGYPHDTAECAWFRGQSPLAIVAGHIVDASPPGQGTGGMQEGRGHRTCMIDARWREVGIGLVPWGKDQRSNVQLYGVDQGLGRVLGGVAIHDLDGDEFYDVGEGLGGVHVRVGDHSTMTGDSGAFRIDLPRGAGGQLTARLASLELVRKIAPGNDNATVDLHFDVARGVADLESRLAALPPGAAEPRRELLLRLLQLRAPRNADETALAAEVAALQAGVLASLGVAPRPEADALRRAGERTFARTVVASWLADAATTDRLLRAAATVLTIGDGKRRTRRAAELAAEVDRALAAVHSPDLWRRLAALRRGLTTTR